MTRANRPDVDCKQLHASLAVDDVLAAVDFYTTKAGFTTAFTWGGHGSYRIVERV